MNGPSTPISRTKKKDRELQEKLFTRCCSFRRSDRQAMAMHATLCSVSASCADMLSFESLNDRNCKTLDSYTTCYSLQPTGAAAPSMRAHAPSTQPSLAVTNHSVASLPNPYSHDEAVLQTVASFV